MSGELKAGQRAWEQETNLRWAYVSKELRWWEKWDRLQCRHLMGGAKEAA